MITEDDFRAIRESVNSGAISSASKAQLERFAVVLCHPHAFSFFGNNQFPQICETVRLHLLRAHIDTLQGHITELNARNTTIQKWVMALAIAALVSTVIQTIVAIRGELRAASQPGSISGPQHKAAPATPPASQPEAVSPVTSNLAARRTRGSRGAMHPSVLARQWLPRYRKISGSDPIKNVIHPDAREAPCQFNRLSARAGGRERYRPTKSS